MKQAMLICVLLNGPSMPLAAHRQFVYHQTMDVAHHPGLAVSKIAAAIGEPARARMLFCLLDGHARTSTELAVVAEVAPSTASVHLNRLKTERLVKVFGQGKYRYYSLDGPNVASTLEGLSVLAGASRDEFVPSTPSPVRAARTCYAHMAGAIAVSLHNRFKTLGWLSGGSTRSGEGYELTRAGSEGFEALGIDLAATRA